MSTLLTLPHLALSQIEVAVIAIVLQMRKTKTQEDDIFKFTQLEISRTRNASIC